MNFKKLDDNNFILFAAHYYDNPQCSGTEEFYEDIQRLKYIKKLITRYQDTGDLKDRLILNHLIILNNVFGPQALSRIVCFKLRNQLQYIKPFLVLLNILPEVVYGIGEKSENIITDEIPMDDHIVKVLREI
jgi:hypothetical protein